MTVTDLGGDRRRRHADARQPDEVRSTCAPDRRARAVHEVHRARHHGRQELERRRRRPRTSGPSRPARARRRSVRRAHAGRQRRRRVHRRAGHGALRPQAQPGVGHDLDVQPAAGRGRRRRRGHASLRRATRTARLQPSARLSQSTSYTATLTTGIQATRRHGDDRARHVELHDRHQPHGHRPLPRAARERALARRRACARRSRARPTPPPSTPRTDASHRPRRRRGPGDGELRRDDADRDARPDLAALAARRPTR